MTKLRPVTKIINIMLIIIIIIIIITWTLAAGSQWTYEVQSGRRAGSQSPLTNLQHGQHSGVHDDGNDGNDDDIDIDNDDDDDEYDDDDGNHL